MYTFNTSLPHISICTHKITWFFPIFWWVEAHNKIFKEERKIFSLCLLVCHYHLSWCIIYLIKMEMGKKSPCQDTKKEARWWVIIFFWIQLTWQIEKIQSFLESGVVPELVVCIVGDGKKVDTVEVMLGFINWYIFFFVSCGHNNVLCFWKKKKRHQIKNSFSAISLRISFLEESIFNYYCHNDLWPQGHNKMHTFFCSFFLANSGFSLKPGE